MGSCLSCTGQNSDPNPAPPASPGGRRRRRSRWIDDTPVDSLHRIPGRTFLSGSTSAASLFTQQGKKGINQDAMVVWENFDCRSDTIFCGVFDGHGQNGHLVSRKVRDILPLNLLASWRISAENDEYGENSISKRGSFASDTTSVCSDDESTHPKIFTALKDLFLQTFRIVDKELRLDPDIDCFYSGTTAVTLVKQGQDLVVGHVGDSRAVLGTRDQNNALVAVQLTMDHKPNVPREADRVRRNRGRIFNLQDEPGVHRLWLPTADFPGLAMSRSFGDFCLKDYGLISVPMVSHRCITEKDEFIILATDGIWDVLSNQEVVDIVASAPSRSSAAHCLVESAVYAWSIRFPTSRTDDCAAVCLFLNADLSNDSSTAYARNHLGPVSGTRVGNEQTD